MHTQRQGLNKRAETSQRKAVVHWSSSSLLLLSPSSWLLSHTLDHQVDNDGVEAQRVGRSAGVVSRILRFD